MTNATDSGTQGSVRAAEPSQEEVGRFYDAFLKSTMLNYRVDGNRRVEEAIRFMSSYVRPDDTAVDIGCGIGIGAEALASMAARGRVVGIDISPEMIWYARKTVNLPNLAFVCTVDLMDAVERPVTCSR